MPCIRIAGASASICESYSRRANTRTLCCTSRCRIWRRLIVWVTLAEIDIQQTMRPIDRGPVAFAQSGRLWQDVWARFVVRLRAPHADRIIAQVTCVVRHEEHCIHLLLAEVACNLCTLRLFCELLCLLLRLPPAIFAPLARLWLEGRRAKL